MRRLAIAFLLGLSACCTQPTLKKTPPNLNNGTSGGSSGGTTGGTDGGNHVPDAGTPDAGFYTPPTKSPDCQPIPYPSPCSSYSDCGANQICLAQGCQPAACAQCGLTGQPNCPQPLDCNHGSCVAPPPGGSSSGTGSSSGSVGNTSGNSSGTGAGGTSGGSGTGAGGTSGGSGTGAGGTSGGSGTGVGGTSGGSGTGVGGTSGGSGTGVGGTSGGSGTGVGGTSGSSGTGVGGTTGGSTGGPITQPDGGACQQDPNLAGQWSMQSQYEVSQGMTNALGGVIQALNDIQQMLQLVQVLLQATGSSVQIPAWVNPLLNDLLNIRYVLSKLDVNGNLALSNASGPMSYTAQETWQDVELVTPNGTQIGLSQDADGGNGYFYFTSPPAYGVQTCSGTAIFDKHDLEGALAGIIPPLLDAVVRYETCYVNTSGPCFQTLNDALQAMIDCAQFTPPPPPPDQAVDAGLSCGLDSDCNQCRPDTSAICDTQTSSCVYGCNSNYDCGAGYYCDSTQSPPGCVGGLTGSASATTVSGQTGGACQTDSDCSNGKPGTGVFCQGGGDGGSGTCTAGCNGVDNWACANGDICVWNPTYTAKGCYTLQGQDGGTPAFQSKTDTGCPCLGCEQTDAGTPESSATKLCDSLSGKLLSELTSFLTQLTFQMGVASVEGSCTVASQTSLTNGVWNGSLAFVPLTGSFSADQTSGPDGG